MAVAIVLIAAVAIGVFAASRSTGNRRREQLVSDIEAAYEQENKAKIEILVSRFIKDYPGSEEEERFIAMVEEVTGLTLAGSTPAPTNDPASELTDWLLENARSSVLAISHIAMSAPNMHGEVNVELAFSNRSDKTVSQLVFEIEFYDADGNAIPSETSGKTKVAALSRGEFPETETPVRKIWVACFTNPEAVSLKLISVRLDYQDGEILVLDEAVCDTIVG
ncbi:hypothetical protein LJC34_05650 [Oscillospiraceae bacterium OttesenSCG-928-G22]|nr:hypothetical protein [Oscillospiraceae bacterium OttesenSCG-928-G22]